MKRALFAVFAVLAFLLVSTASFAGEKKVPSSMSAKSFQAFDPSFEQAHVSSSLSVDTGVPVKVINFAAETPVLHIDFYAPTSQFYTKIYIVSDTAGTIVSLPIFTDFLEAGFTAFDLNTPLPPGDYTFTALAVGSMDGSAAISDPYKFSVF
jgi:hypothetical protein